MKKLITCTILLLVLLTSHGQGNFQMDSTSKWAQEEYWDDGGKVSEHEYFWISIEGDTSFSWSNNGYFKMCKEGYGYYWAHGYGTYEEPIPKSYYGALLIDTNKVYLVFPGTTENTLLYDFSLTIGDYISAFAAMGGGLRIENIDTLPDGRRKFITNDPEFFYLEGIGSNKGLVNYNVFSYMMLTTAVLGCYYQSDSLVYTFNYSVCDFLTSLTDLDENTVNETIKYYPNPADDFIIFEVDSNHSILHLQVYNIHGQLVINKQITNQERISIIDLNPGIYIYKLSKDQQVLGNGKFHVR